MSFVVAFAAGGCSGKDHGPGAPENPSVPANNGAAGSGANPGAGSGPNQSGAGGKGSPANGSIPAGVPAAVNRILALAHRSDGATFTATYRVRLPNGKHATTTLAQQPPKFGFHLVQGSQRNVVVSDGKLVHGCLSSGRGWRCTQSGVDDPSQVGSAYPPAVLQILDGLITGAGREVRLGTARRTVQGARVDCATFTATIQHPPPAQVYCIRRDGVLAYARTVDQQIVEITSFKPSVDARLMAVPR
jgi:hypothetical protein